MYTYIHNITQSNSRCVRAFIVVTYRYADITYYFFLNFFYFIFFVFIVHTGRLVVFFFLFNLVFSPRREPSDIRRIHVLRREYRFVCINFDTCYFFRPYDFRRSKPNVFRLRKTRSVPFSSSTSFLDFKTTAFQTSVLGVYNIVGNNYDCYSLWITVEDTRAKRFSDFLPDPHENKKNK